MDPAAPGAWKDAWSVGRHCSGSHGPTGFPSSNPVDSIGNCPDECSSSTHTKYNEGNLITITMSIIPIRKVAYHCKAYPFGGYCGIFSLIVFDNDQGWAFAGSCDGSVGPTASPNFVELSTMTSCPPEWNPFTVDYEAGDLVLY